VSAEYSYIIDATTNIVVTGVKSSSGSSGGYDPYKDEPW
jgi:hypothetical protein